MTEPAHPALADDGPADPDRSWDWRDPGDGDEEPERPEPPISPVDTLASFAYAAYRFPAMVTPR